MKRFILFVVFVLCFCDFLFSAYESVKRIITEEYIGKAIVEREVETFYSGKKTLRMQQAEDGTYILVDPERCTYTLEGLAKSDFTRRDIVSDSVLAEHITSFIKNANPITDEDGDWSWDFFELKQIGVFSFNANDSVDLDTCRFNYIFWLEKDGKWLYSNQTYGEGALIDTMPPIEMNINNCRLERDSVYTFKLKHRAFSGKEKELYSFDFVARESGRIQFPDSLGVDGYIDIINVIRHNHALDVHYAMNNLYCYYKNIHNRNSFDGKGSPVYAFVDFNDPVWYGEWTSNAAASGAEPYFVAVGCGTKWSNDLNNFGSFDFLASVYAHLVVATNGRGGLLEEGESGALLEGISDCLAVAADFYINKDNANWQIGEDIIKNGDIPNMRDLSDPKISGGGLYNPSTLSYPQPDTYQGENWVDPSNLNSDNGGIHFNNGVFNYWFYLLTEGGSGVNDNEQVYEVEGIGMQKTEKLLMHIILNYLEPDMNFVRMRSVSQLAAIELWGDDSEDVVQVLKAWNAVGVAESYLISTGSENPSMGGVKVTLTAEPIEGFEFVEWTDGNTDNPRILTLTENIEVYARFQMAQGGNPVDLETSKISSANIYTTNGILHIEGATTDYHILDAAGRLIYSGNASTLQLPRGIYLITIGGEVEKIVL